MYTERHGRTERCGAGVHQRARRKGPVAAVVGAVLTLLVAPAPWDSGATGRATAPVRVVRHGAPAWPGRSRGRGVTPALQDTLTLSDARAGDRFGSVVAASDATVLVGAPGRDNNAGAVYVFAQRGAAWLQRATLSAANRRHDDYFGSSVSIGGDTVLIGAPARDGGVGAAYVFTRSGSAWLQQAMLSAADPRRHDTFGAAVALSGDTALIGADGKNANAGAVYVFARHGSVWRQQDTLIPAAGRHDDYFGVSVVLSGTTALIGAPGNAGAAYVFTRSGSAWRQQAKLTVPTAQSDDEVGLSVALAGPTALVSATGMRYKAGAVYAFTQRGGAWRQGSALTASDGQPNDELGASIALSGDIALIGAGGKSVDRADKVGGAYLFAHSGLVWRQAVALDNPNGEYGDEFGLTVALGTDTAVIGAPGQNNDAGASYLFGPLTRTLPGVNG